MPDKCKHGLRKPERKQLARFPGCVRLCRLLALRFLSVHEVCSRSTETAAADPGQHQNGHGPVLSSQAGREPHSLLPAWGAPGSPSLTLVHEGRLGGCAAGDLSSVHVSTHFKKAM